jgi:hypothetical protein
MMRIAAHVLDSVVDILDKYEKIDFISLTKADQEGLLDKIPVHQRYKSFHLIRKEKQKADLRPFLN